MNKELLKRWVKALRSGKYEQGRSVLCDRDIVSSGVRYCCLGVLRDIEPSIEVHPMHRNGLLSYASLQQHMGGDIDQRDLAERNDNDWTFPEIADFIEKKYLNNEEDK